MRRSISEWFTVVDARGRFTWAVGMALAFVVSLFEIGGAAIVVAALQLVTEPIGSPVTLPILGDIEDLLPGSDRVADLRWLALFGLAFFSLRGALVIGQLYLTFRAAFSLAVRLTDRVTEALLRRPYSWHLSQNSSELATMAVIVPEQFCKGVFAPVQLVGAQALVVVALGTVAIVVEPVGAIGALLVLGVVMSMILRTTRRRLVRLGEIEVEETTRSQRVATESLTAVREVTVLELGPAVRNALWASRSRWSRALRDRATIVALPRVLIETVAFSALIVLLAARGDVGGDALAGIGLVGYAVVRLLPTVNGLITQVNMARGSQASMQVLADLLVEPAMTDEPEPTLDETTGRQLLPLVARGIQYSYPGGETVLRGVDLRLDRGTTIGIVGLTGCGKSTLLDLLIGLLPPSDGELLLNGLPLAAHRRAWWNQIGVVPQSITLLDATLAENIALGAGVRGIDPEALATAVKLAQLGPVVDKLPDGERTRIGDRGIRLSGGQRQRVAIARALYRDPPTIFLDEGTSALDQATEQAVIEALRTNRPDRTLVMVAHRISTLRDCDEILLLERGRVAARGTHDELLAGSATFRQLAAVDDK